MGHVEQATNLDPIRSKFTNDPDFEVLLETFVGSISQIRQDLEQTLSSGRMDALRTQAYDLRGSGGGYGFGDLSDLAAQLEDACRTNDVESARGILDRLLSHMDRIVV